MLADTDEAMAIGIGLENGHDNGVGDVGLDGAIVVAQAIEVNF
jgi:hypothetical protein